MDTLQQEAFSTQKMHYLGSVMDVIDQPGVAQYIDQELPLDSSKGAIISMGQRVAAMITNGRTRPPFTCILSLSLKIA